MAHPANATDLSPDAQLLHLESDFAWNQRRVGELGQARAHRQRTRESLACHCLRDLPSSVRAAHYRCRSVFTKTTRPRSVALARKTLFDPNRAGLRGLDPLAVVKSTF